MFRSDLKKVLLPYFLLILLPCTFSIVLYLLILKIDKDHEIEDIKTKLSERAVDFMAKTSAEDYFQPYFNNLANSLMPFIENKPDKNGSVMSNQEVSKLIKDFSNKLGENLRCAIFNIKMQLINPQDLFPHEQRFFTYTWKRIHGYEYTYDERRIDQNNIIGDEFHPSFLIGYSEACIPTICPERTCVFYFKNANFDTNGLILFVEYKRTKQEIIMAKIKDFATYEQPIILYDIDKKQKLTPSLSHNEMPYEKTNTDEVLDGIIEKDTVWKAFNSGEYRLLFGQTTDLSSKYQNKLFIGIFIFLLLLILFSTFFFKNLSSEKGMYISIRYKLVFIFAIAVYIPAISLWVLSYTSLHNHRIAIENNVKKGLVDILTKIDTDYKTKETVIKNCYSELDKFLKNLKGKKLPTQETFRKKVIEIVGENALRRNEIFTWLDIRRVDKTQIFTTSSDESNDRIKAIARVLCILCLERYCPERLTYAGVKPSQSDILVGNLLENPVVGFSHTLERPNQLSYLDLDKSGGIYWWWNYYPEVDNPVAFVMCNATTRNLSLSYFNSLLKNRYSVSNTEIKVINYHIETQRFIPEVKETKDFLDLIKVASANKTIESSVIKHNDRKYICLCVPGSTIKDGYILGLYPISEIDYKIVETRRTIYKVMILLLIISIFTGLLLSQNFIIPVNELNRGLEALRKRETETTIKIENKDELGHLGNAFNQMMAEIKDMLMAGAVQQCLIPTGNQNIEGYDCIIYNQMAADVGGDYADMFQLPDNRVLIVIGDVNGHGVSSSLIAAMVKASVFLFANQNLPLNEIVTNTSYMILDLIGNKLPMKFCAITLDKATGELNLCNAGHPFPFIREKEIGKMRTLTNINLPMGISKARSKYSYESVVLNQEETLLLYTDGFIEACSNKTDEFGYDNLKNTFLNCSIDNTEELKNLLIDTYKKNLGKKELMDDITFIILRRNPLQSN